MQAIKRSPAAEGQRMTYIDAARGLAIIAVVLGHLPPVPPELVRYIYSFHVPLFFITSGILLSRKDSWKTLSMKELAIKKAKSLLYPYVTISLISFVIVLIRDGAARAVDSAFRLLSFDGIGALWFLPGLFIAELAFFFAMKYLKGKWRAGYFAAILLITALFGLLHFRDIENRAFRRFFAVINIVNRALIGCLFVLAGYYFGRMREKYHPNKTVLIATAAAAFFVNAVLFRFNYVDLIYSTIGNPVLFYLNAFLGSYAVLTLSEYIFKKSSLLRFYGRNSFIIFATHVNFGITGAALQLSKAVASQWMAASAFMITMIVETVLIWVINHYGAVLVDYNKFAQITKIHRA